MDHSIAGIANTGNRGSTGPPAAWNFHISRIDPTLLSRILVFVALAAQIFVAWRYWSLTWDDSAITLGFSRTFALTGRIEPTPGSGIVEGYSTTLWMLLMTAAAKFAASPAALLATAKISSLLLNLANILLIRRWFLSWVPEPCANLVAGAVGCGLMFYETINGMETPLLLALVLVMLLLLPLPSLAWRLCYLLTGVAFLLTRWEAVWLLVPFVLVEKTMRRAVIDSVSWLGMFILSNLARWHYFGSILPNTIIAKRGVPYSSSVHRLEIFRHLREPIYILASCKILIVPLIASLLYNRFVLTQREPLLDRLRLHLRRSWQLRFTFLYTLFSLVLSTAIGQNWGPEFRSFYSAWPFLFCLLLLPLTSILRDRALPWITAVIIIFSLSRMAVRIHELNSPNGPAYMPGATIANVAATNTLLKVVANAAHRQTLVYAGPDIGGIMLYGNGIRIIDLGLLCDPVLARQRYAAINSYVLQERHPDVIEVHQVWTMYSKFQTYPLFREQYRPVYINGSRVFVSRSLIAEIDPYRLTEESFTPTGSLHGEELDSHYSALDYSVNQTFGTYLLLK